MKIQDAMIENVGIEGEEKQILLGSGRDPAPAQNTLHKLEMSVIPESSVRTESEARLLGLSDVKLIELNGENQPQKKDIVVPRPFINTPLTKPRFTKNPLKQFDQLTESAISNKNVIEQILTPENMEEFFIKRSSKARKASRIEQQRLQNEDGVQEVTSIVFWENLQKDTIEITEHPNADSVKLFNQEPNSNREKLQQQNSSEAKLLETLNGRIIQQESNSLYGNS